MGTVFTCRHRDCRAVRLTQFQRLIPTRADHHALAQSRRPMDMMSQGWSMRRFQASQQ